MQIQPYLFFDGRCEEAIEFYRTALGAEVIQLMRFKGQTWERFGEIISSDTGG